MNDNELFVSIEQIRKWFCNMWGRHPSLETLRLIATKNECNYNLQKQKGDKSDSKEITKET